MEFGSLSFRNRFFRMGDEAETVFEKYAEANRIMYQRYGFNRPPLTKFRYLAPFVRNTPDYVAQWNKKLFFVECKGTAYNHVKIKPEQMNILRDWNTFETVVFFVYNSRNNAVTWITFDEVQNISSGLQVKIFTSDNKEYWEVPLVWNKRIEQVI